MIQALQSMLFRKRLNRIKHFVENPIDVQKNVFDNLICRGRDTEWGIKYGYHSIKNFDDFDRNVPVNSYDDLKPYFQRILNGEQNILWDSRIRYFSKSSGTTADKSKFIPVSDEALHENHYGTGKDMLCLYVSNRPDTHLFSGRSLGMGGSYTQQGDMIVGDVSAILMKYLPFWAELLRSPDIDTALMKEWEKKIEIIASKTATQDIVSIAGVPSWMLVLLNKIVLNNGCEQITDVWTNLEVYFHGGVNFNPYREQYKRLIKSGKVAYIETYNASEGFFGVQDTLCDDGMMLMLDNGIYYEFIPIDELDKARPRVLTLSEVEINTNYALIISTNAGLWRYMIGDTVMFNSLSPYRVKVTGRTKSYINLAGEELMVSNADKAIEETCRELKCTVNEYTAAPYMNDDGKDLKHEWIVEFDVKPDSIERFTEVLDANLKMINSDYEAKRYKNMILGLPLVHQVEKGVFYGYMKAMNRLGGQNKVPRLSSNRTLIDNILGFVEG